MVNHSIALLVVLPLAAAIAMLFLRGQILAQRTLAVAAIGACLTLSIVWLARTPAVGLYVSQVGEWRAPYGITIALDPLSGIMLSAANFVALMGLLHSFSTLAPRVEGAWFHPLFQTLVMGVNYAFITGDLFNLFVAFEIMLMASYALLCLGASRAQLSQAYKYVMLNLIGSTFFVLGAGLMYGMTGTLNFADLARLVAAADTLPPGFHAVSLMLLFVFALKAAIFPLWFWLPDCYPTCPIAIAAVFSGVLTKVGVYALVRTVPLFLGAPGADAGGWILPVLSIGAGATMVLAILGALALASIRRILAFTLISHMGYLVFGLVLMTPEAIAGAVFYMAQHMIVMTALFLCCGLLEARAGSDELGRVSALARSSPALGVLFFLSAMSLAGLPPFSGFFGKAIILREAFIASTPTAFALAGCAILTSVLTLLVMAKVWCRAFWSPPTAPRDEAPSLTPRPSLAPAWFAAGALVASSLALALFAQPVLNLSLAAARSVTDPAQYVNAVFQRADAFPTSPPGRGRSAAGGLGEGMSVAAPPEHSAAEPPQ